MCDIVWKKLESDKPPELYILGLINHTHPTAAQLLDDAVMGDNLPDDFGGRGH